MARDKPAGARRQIPAFSAIGRDLVEHRVGEIALRARAYRPALSFERRSVAELMQAMMEVASIRASAGLPPPLCLAASDLIGEEVIRLTYVPA